MSDKPSKPSLTDVKTLRARARKNIEEGAITDSYGADRKTVLRLLNEALATELVCVLRYRRHYFMASGLDADAVAEEFLAHSNEEQGHADQIAARIVQLNGEPEFDLDGLVNGSITSVGIIARVNLSVIGHAPDTDGGHLFG